MALDDNSLSGWLAEFYKFKKLAEHAGKFQGQMRDLILEEIEDLHTTVPPEGAEGQWWEDDKGSQFVLLPEPVEDPKGRTITTVKREKRVSQSLNEERANELLGSKGLLEQCITFVPVLDEDAVLALNYGEQLSDADLQSLYDEKVTWAFVQVEE